MSESLKQERLEALMDVQRGISFEANMDLIGSRSSALVDRLVDDDPDFGAIARTAAQALDVDGVTQLLAGAAVRPGEMVEVEIVDALEYDLVGRVVE